MELTLKQARLLSGYSQVAIAEKMGVHRHTYSSWEKNPDDMPIGKAKDFARITGVKLDQIFFNTESTLSR